MERLRHILRTTRTKVPAIHLIDTRKLFFEAGIALLALGILIVLLAKNVSAEAADNILRPLLGEKGTLALEALYFNTQDTFNAGEYTLLGSKSLAVTDDSSLQATKINNIDKMDLKNIPSDPGFPPLAQEGQWLPLTQNLFPGQTVMAKTFIRPDADRAYAIAYLVKIDMHKLGIGAEAGTYYPGGGRGPGIVPKNIQASQDLLAVFNGGFQKKDGEYGMVVGSKTYVPLKINMPTLVLYKNGNATFVTYTGQTFASDAAALRQNGPYLIENGVITPYVEQGNDTWGRTITNNMYTWRSGLGITKKGNLVYAAGNSLIPQTLAKALQKAGAVNAIQLDINPPWVRFIQYQSIGNGQYSFTPLLPSMQGGREYLKGYNKDFFYIYKK